MEEGGPSVRRSPLLQVVDNQVRSLRRVGRRHPGRQGSRSRNPGKIDAPRRSRRLFRGNSAPDPESVFRKPRRRSRSEENDPAVRGSRQFASQKQGVGTVGKSILRNRGFAGSCGNLKITDRFRRGPGGDQNRPSGIQNRRGFFRVLQRGRLGNHRDRRNLTVTPNRLSQRSGHRQHRQQKTEKMQRILQFFP